MQLAFLSSSTNVGAGAGTIRPVGVGLYMQIALYRLSFKTVQESTHNFCSNSMCSKTSESVAVLAQQYSFTVRGYLPEAVDVSDAQWHSTTNMPNRNTKYLYDT